jgi:hypothetical protein
VQFRALARGFPWASDEEVVVVAGAVRLLVHQSVQLAAAFLAAAGAIAEAALRRDGPQVAGPERGW